MNTEQPIGDREASAVVISAAELRLTANQISSLTAKELNALATRINTLADHVEQREMEIDRLRAENERLAPLVEAATVVKELRVEAADPQPFWVTRMQAADRRLYAAVDALTDTDDTEGAG